MFIFSVWSVVRHYQKTGNAVWAKTNWPFIFVCVHTCNVPPATNMNTAAGDSAVQWLDQEEVLCVVGEACLCAGGGAEYRVGISGIVIFFAVSYPGFVFPDW
ncbi:hypothetical protein BJ546DRAFT_114319 [Cryomyces antarcticus]